MLVVDCFFFAFLEWWLPREEMDIVEDDDEWNASKHQRVSLDFLVCDRLFTPHLVFR